MASSTQASAPARRSLTDRFLHIVEVGGNALPHPATLFALLTLCILVGSWLAVRLDVSALHPATNEIIQEFADLLAVIANAAADNTISPEESKKIRARWEELKTVTEAFVHCCEEGNFRALKEAAPCPPKPTPTPTAGAATS